VNLAGVLAAKAVLTSKGSVCEVFVGIRNGSSSAQGVAALLKQGVELYAVDTAMRARIFHPKLYLGIGDGQARAVIGSANLTHAGLFNNIEAGADLALDLSDQHDNEFVQRYQAGFQALIQSHPKHCFKITSGRQIIDLMRQGLLEDERSPKTESVVGAGGQGSKTSKPRINLPFVAPPKTKKTRPKKPAGVAGAAMSAVPHYGQLVWAKPNLPQGDLQLLTHGHASGVLRLTQAGYQVNGQVIDQTKYFRRQVFSGLNWTVDPNDAGKEIADAPISLVIAGVYVGDFDLRLSHKPAWEAGQGNYTTGLHWDHAVDHIKEKGLIGRTLRLYEPALPKGRFVIEID
jgi:hypothetical protein